MVWGLLSRRRMIVTSEVMRRTHSRWLTRAFASGREYPRIPVRAVSAGGFTRLMTRPGGPMLAERWWSCALERVDDVEADD
jgi:hypothetical protein